MEKASGGSCVSVVAASFAAFSILVAVSCESATAAKDTERPEGLFVAASWNVQSLFDGTDDGVEYEDYAAGKGWTEEKYRERLKRVGTVVAGMSEHGPDLLGLIEVENEGVVDDLLSGSLDKFGYRWSAFAALPGASLGLGVVSRLPIVSCRAHGASYLGEAAPRPLLEVRLDAGSGPIVVFVAHWKSKLGGEAETEGLRRAAAKTLARRVAEIEADGTGASVVVLGDLNENWDEFERRGCSYPTALLPDDEEAARAVETSGRNLGGPYVVVSGEEPPVCGLIGGGVPFFTPWPGSEYRGSYAYRGAWETIDHVLLSASLFDGLGWEYADFRVAEVGEAVTRDGFPVSYDPRTGNGYSDHLPLVVQLVRVP